MPPADVENRENRACSEGNFPSLVEDVAQRRGCVTFNGIYVPDNRNFPKQVQSPVTSHAVTRLKPILDLESISTGRNV